MLKMLLILIVASLAVIAYRAVTGEETGYMLRRRFGARFCAAIGHRRSAGSVRKVEDSSYVSRCRRCGTRLVKDTREGEWHVPARKADDAHEGDLPGEGHVQVLSVGVGLLVAGAAVIAGYLVAPHHLHPRDASSAPSALALWQARR